MCVCMGTCHVLVCVFSFLSVVMVLSCMVYVKKNETNNYAKYISHFFFDELNKQFFMPTNELRDQFYGVTSLQAKEDLSITA